jgi:hypothetical protein
VGAIDEYIVDLSAALRGPRRHKADLLAEARGSLVDAAEAYQRSGLERHEAQRHAVRDFGDVAAVSPAYQTELRLCQARRTALQVLLVLLVQPLVWARAWRAVVSGWTAEPGPEYVFLHHLVNWLGTATMAVALAAVLGCGVGVRYFGAHRALTRFTAVFAFAVAAVFSTAGVLLTILSPQGSLLAITGLPWTVAFLLAPLAGVAVSARRCLLAI